MKLERYTGPWDDDDPDANFKAAVADYTRVDPMPTFERLSANTGIPVSALVRYALVRWAAEGSEALMALGPQLVARLWAVVTAAEEDGSEEAKLQAYETLRQMISWLRVPLTEDDAATRGDGSP